jgi:hypothetical protein
MSQKARKSAARLAAACPRAGKASRAGALNRQIQSRSTTLQAIAPAACEGTPSEKSDQAERQSDSAFETSSVSCDAAESYHVPRNRESIGGDHRRHFTSAQELRPLERTCLDNAKDEISERFYLAATATANKKRRSEDEI